MKFLPEYDGLYAPRLAHRSETFRRVFELLERRRENGHLIVETGCLRANGNWAGDGQSTLLFDRFAGTHDGEVLSVDLSSEACAAARAVVSPRVTVACGDSVRFLHELRPSRPIDLVYLDSFDLDWDNPHPSSLHHLKELCAVFPKLGSGSIVVVDDNMNGRGKGAYVHSFMENLGIEPAFSAYQIGWVLP